MAAGKLPGTAEMQHSDTEQGHDAAASYKVGKVTEEQKAEQHKRFNIKYLTDNFRMAERAQASFDSRTQVGTGLPALAAVPNVIASHNYGEKKTATQ